MLTLPTLNRAICKYLSWTSASDCQGSVKIGSLTMTWSFCLHRQYSMSRQQNSFLINFSRTKNAIVICNYNTKENFSWEPEKTNAKFQKIISYLWNFQKFTCVSQFLWNLTFIFSDCHEDFSLVLLQMTNYILRPLRIKITQFPGGFRLKTNKLNEKASTYAEKSRKLYFTELKPEGEN